MSINITEDDVLKFFSRIKEEFPKDFKYSDLERPDDEDDRCMYVHRDAPGCIVGHFLHSKGIPLVALSNHEGENAIDLLENLETEDEIIVVVDKDAMDLLQNAQREQDIGNTWHGAIDYAIMWNFKDEEDSK